MILLTEGDANTSTSWSGCANALLLALRKQGVDVATVDASLQGLVSMYSKIANVSLSRRRWAARYHYGALSFRLRSARASRAVARLPANRPILQAGATFCAIQQSRESFYVYADAHALFGQNAGKKRSAALPERELRDMIERERMVYSRATAIFTMSECLRHSFISDFGMAPEKVITVHAGTNLKQVPSSEALEAPRSPEPTVLFVGKEFERKGGGVLVKAFHRVRQAIPNARLIIVGASPDVAHAAGIDVRGFINRDRQGAGSLTSLYRSADLFCMPSLYEPFGVVFVEAMMHGLPCIGTTEWAMPEIIDDGRTGWLVPPNNVDALSDKLIVALRDRARLRAMGAVARLVAAARFTWEQVARKMLERIFPSVHKPEVAQR